MRTAGPAGSDWDVAVVDRTAGQVLNGGAGSGASEVVTAIVRAGQDLVVQTCRRSGVEAVDLTVSFVSADFTPAADGYKLRLVRVAVKPSERARLASLGLDMTDHAAPGHQDVLLYSAADERKLTDAGFTFSTRIADVVARDRQNRLTEQRAKRDAKARKSAAADLPSGRTTYRTLPEIEEELKQLAADNPTLVRLFTLPLKSVEGRDILGIEIAENVTATGDGRPVFTVFGTHHAREWPANEATMEFGLELIQGYKAGDARLTQIVRQGRTFIVPVVNVDGFDVTTQSEGLTPGGNYSDPLNTGGASGNQNVGTGAYKRKNCRKHAADPNPLPEVPCLARSYPPGPNTNDRGVDLNRNYGVLWAAPAPPATSTTSRSTAPGRSPSPRRKASGASCATSSRPSRSAITRSPA